MKCHEMGTSKRCIFYYCNNPNKRVVEYCTCRGVELKELDTSILNNCEKYVDSSYLRHDILKSKY